MAKIKQQKCPPDGTNIFGHVAKLVAPAVREYRMQSRTNVQKRKKKKKKTNKQI